MIFLSSVIFDVFFLKKKKILPLYIDFGGNKEFDFNKQH